MELKESNALNEGQAGQWYAYLVAFVAAVGGFLFGFDLNIIGSGMVFVKDQFNLDSTQLGFATGSAILGCIAGPFLAVGLGDRLGRKNCLFLAAVLFAISAIGSALPRTITEFNIYRIIGGLGIGFSSVVAPMYIAEIAPAAKRGRLVLMYQLAITLGAMIGVVLAYILADRLAAHIGWRWMFGSEAIPVVLFVIFLTMAPRSPRWLAEKNRHDEALAVLTKINGRQKAQEEMKEIQSSIAEETGTFAEVFEPGYRYALLIAVILAFLNNLTGWSCVAYYLPILFQKAGFPDPAEAIGKSVILMICNTLLTFVVIALVDRVGRKKLWIFGSAMMIFSTLFMGYVFQAGITGNLVVLAVFLVLIPHAVALGPLPWLMISELFPTRIRARAVGIATVCVWIGGYMGTQLFPMLNSWFESKNLPGGTYWIFTVLCVLSLLFGIKMLPETKNRTLEEIARSWKK